MAINRTIHQIWIGDKPIPADCKAWCSEWKSLHRGWEYHLWGNELFEKYADDPYVSFMNNSNEKLAFVSDRFRVLLLREFGGVYLDADCLPVRKLDTIAHILDRPDVDFVTGLRPPDRKFVALHRGISLVDNTVMLSAKNGRMINRICSLYTPESRKQNGYSMGLEVIRHADHTTVLLNSRYFYGSSPTPETILLHDNHNLGSWSPVKVPHPNHETQKPRPSAVSAS